MNVGSTVETELDYGLYTARLFGAIRMAATGRMARNASTRDRMWHSAPRHGGCQSRLQYGASTAGPLSASPTTLTGCVDTRALCPGFRQRERSLRPERYHMSCAAVGLDSFVISLKQCLSSRGSYLAF